MNKQRLTYLNFIRALATFLIVAFHFYFNNKSFVTLPYNFNINIGEIGVSLFFIVSGASLFYNYQNNFNAINYFKKRFFSIYPMFWLAYISTTLLYFYLYKATDTSINKIRYILTIIGFDGYLSYRTQTFYLLGEWFLGCIILFYIIFPILRSIMIKFPKLLIIISLILYFSMLFIYNNYSLKMPVGWNILIRLPEFLFGMYYIKYIKKTNTPIFILSILTYIALQYLPLRINHVVEGTFTGIILFLILVWVGEVMPKHINNIIDIVCKYSYAIFLTHHIIIIQLQNRYNNIVLKNYERVYLFIIAWVFIAAFSKLLYIINDKILSFIKTLPHTNIEK